jgi:DASH complex subunit DAD3
MSTLLLALSNAPSAAILDGLRGLERKTTSVFTLLKASVYSIVLNQQITVGLEGTEEQREKEAREREDRARRRAEMDG